MSNFTHVFGDGALDVHHFVVDFVILALDDGFRHFGIRKNHETETTTSLRIWLDNDLIEISIRRRFEILSSNCFN